MHTEDLALFSVPPMNVSEDDIQWINYEPYFGKDGKGSIHFNISGTGNHYTNLGKSNLFVWISLRKLKGEPFIQEQNEHTVAIKSAVPIDNVLHSLWFNVTSVSILEWSVHPPIITCTKLTSKHCSTSTPWHMTNKWNSLATLETVSTCCKQIPWVYPFQLG